MARIAFMGTSDFSVPIIQKIIKEKYKVVAIYTQPDKPMNRGLKKKSCPIKNFYNKELKGKVKLIEPEKLNSKKEIEYLKKLNPSLIIVAAYGKMIPKVILDLPKYGCINIHPSLLPKYRGPTPIQTAILNQDKETGISLIKLNEQMDAGDIIYQKKIPIKDGDTTQSLCNRLAKKSASILSDILPRFFNNELKEKKQDHSKASYTKIIKKSDGLIDWKNENASQIEAKFRAYQPWPSIYTFFHSSQKNKVIRLEITDLEKNELIQKKTKSKIYLDDSIAKNPFIQTKKGVIIIKSVKPEGKKNMSISEFLNGYGEFINSKLLNQK